MNKLKFQKHFLVTIPRYSILSFFSLMAISMFTYGGGTMNNLDAIGYSFTRNFFSDLGKFVPNNIISMILFTTALMVSGLSFMAYFYNMMRIFKEKSTYAVIAKVGLAVGIYGALCFIGVGFTPHNLLNDPHMFFVNGAFRSFFISAFLLTIAMYKDDRFENRYALGYLGFALSIFIYILILEFAPNPKISDFYLIFNVVSQKIIVLIFMISVLYQSGGNSKFLAQNSNK